MAKVMKDKAKLKRVLEYNYSNDYWYGNISRRDYELFMDTVILIVDLLQEGYELRDIESFLKCTRNMYRH